jgi:hypothetical protein
LLPQNPDFQKSLLRMRLFVLAAQRGRAGRFRSEDFHSNPLRSGRQHPAETFFEAFLQPGF